MSAAQYENSAYQVVERAILGLFVDKNVRCFETAERVLLQASVPLITRARALMVLAHCGDHIGRILRARQAVQLLDNDVRRRCLSLNRPFPGPQLEAVRDTLQWMKAAPSTTSEYDVTSLPEDADVVATVDILSIVPPLSDVTSTSSHALSPSKTGNMAPCSPFDAARTPERSAARDFLTPTSVALNKQDLDAIGGYGLDEEVRRS